MQKGNLEDIKYNDAGLVPAIAQDANTGAVLMMAWMNAKTIAQTLETGIATYYSRSRNKIWVKGETSGHYQHVRGMYYDCDGDTLLLSVEPDGSACHTGEYSCFYRSLMDSEASVRKAGIISELFGVICGRRENPVEGSYTSYLFDKGVDKICKKVGEEAAECIIAAKNGSRDELQYEAADLIYHLLVLLADQGLTPDDVFVELEKRR